MQKEEKIPNIEVSIIMPTLNEENYLQKSLTNIFKNDFDFSKVEVIIVDGGSKDSTRSIISKYENKLNIKFIERKGCTVYEALNIGLENSSGKYFLRVDARSLLPENYIQKCIKHLENKQIKCVGGQQIQFGVNDKSEAIADVTNSFIGTGGAKFRTSRKSGFVDSVYLGVYETSFLKNIGGFEQSSKYVSEDSFINFTIRNKGYKVYLDSTLKVRYPAKTTFRSLAKQYLIYGGGRCFIFKKHKIFTSFRQILPLLFLGINSSLLILSIVNNRFLLLLVFTIVLYLLTIIIFNYSKNQSSKRYILKIFASITIHYAWPIGFILFYFSPNLLTKLIRKKIIN